MRERNAVVWTFYRLIDLSGQHVIDCKSIDLLIGMLRNLSPGRYTVAQISGSSPSAGSILRRWGAMVKFKDGRIIEERDAWEF
jgi:hypothetical protein